MSNTIPSITQGLPRAMISSGSRDREMLPTSFIPRERVRSPQAANTTTPASTRYLRQLTIRFQARLRGFDGGLGRRHLLLVPLLLHNPVARRTQLQERACLLVQTSALVAIEYCLLHDAENCFRAEVVLVVEAVHGLEDFFARQPGILDVGQLVTALIYHLAVRHEPVAHREIVQFRARVGVRHRDLDGFDVQFLGELDRVLDGLARFARQAENEVAVNDQPELVAILGELARAFDRGAFLDVLQDLRIPGLITDDQEA